MRTTKPVVVNVNGRRLTVGSSAAAQAELNRISLQRQEQLSDTALKLIVQLEQHPS
jgi:hypothetical protein